MYGILVKIRGWHTKYTVQTFRGFGVFATTVDKNEPAGVFDVSSWILLKRE